MLLAVVLLLMNTYPLVVSQDLVFRSKAASLQSNVSVMVYSLSGLDRLNTENVTAAMAVVARGSWLWLSRLTEGSRAAVLLAIALAAVVYAMAVLALGAVRREDLLSLPKGEKMADMLHIR